MWYKELQKNNGHILGNLYQLFSCNSEKDAFQAIEFFKQVHNIY